METLKGPAYILEGNPDAKNPLSRVEMNQLLQQESHKGYRIFDDKTVKIKQRQDNIQFAAMVESIDESLGRVLDKLKELGIADHTIVIFYADNGGMSAASFFYEPDRDIPETQLDKAFSTSNLPLRGGKGWLYEGGIRVPLIVKWPNKGLQGIECNVPVTGPDFYPTILDMVGLPLKPEQKTDGVSFVPLLKGEKKLDREAIFWHFPHYSNHGMQSPGDAVLSGDYKLLEYFENNSVQLFNLKEDMEEQDDLSTKDPDKVKELKGLLNSWRKHVSAKMMEPNPAYISTDEN